ncbi:N-6 DNA Methylase [Mycoplasmopsis alligatoris A21JP2]|uniref:site-specific DNA-methyltransferase (adenine-specific) n=1 Tax=Mycoplasmopsis alligatoris A21JP2 TaxID=747682 RepID=D4XVA3_9BACT|nr:N-6 DNA Methylase [Mycoplasmopsis alligatoris A21JP2]
MHENFKPFDIIVSNPPYSTKWEGKNNPLNANDERFSVTTLAPNSKADMAFVMHMINHLSSSGSAAIVEFPGVLYRCGAEKDIREYLVKENLIDTIVKLPNNLFFGTSIYTCILLLRKNKNEQGIFFVDASKEFIKNGKKNKLSKQNLEKIIEIIRYKKEIEDFSILIDHETIANKNFKLSVNSYLNFNDEEEEIDIEELNIKLNTSVKKINILREKINQIIIDLEGSDE